MSLVTAMNSTFYDLIINVDSPDRLNDAAIKIFRQQHENNPVYKHFVDHLKINTKKVETLFQIPFLPIEFFKSHRVITGKYEPTGFFRSSGTTASNTSRHFYENTAIYEKSFLQGFELFYGPVTDYHILALLPSYSEQKNSSLIYMIEKLISLSGKKESGFYLYNYDELFEKINELETAGKRTLLIGVTFALLEFVEKFSCSLKNTIVMETGGMKGRRREMVREELHETLCKGFGVNQIHSEYGMTELFSQAYSKDEGIFGTPPWMKVLIRDVNDPLTLLETQKTGGINVIDLANINSCCFIATQDLGRCYADGNFEVLGRFDHSDVRGCNLLVS